MMIEGRIERAREVTTVSGETCWMIWTKGRKFCTADPEVGVKCVNNVEMYGVFTYRFWIVKGETQANTYYLEDWKKL